MSATWHTLSVYGISLAVSVSAIMVGRNLINKYRSKYLTYFLFFLIAYCLNGFVNLVGRFVVRQYFYALNLKFLQTAEFTLLLLGLPFLAIALYYFLAFTRGICGKEISNLFTIWYCAAWAIVFVLVFLNTKRYFDTQESTIMTTIVRHGALAGHFFYLLALIHLFLILSQVSNVDQRRGIRRFGILYLFVLAVTPIVSSHTLSQMMGIQRSTVLIFFYFLMILPPLVYLDRFLKSYYRRYRINPKEPLNLTSIFKTYNISVREGEIIHLLLNGKGNSTIACHLGISVGTVKNHIYHIYQKMDVKSRDKLTQFIQNYTPGGC